MSSFSPSQAEAALVSLVFANADTQKLGIITGDAAVSVFKGTNLPPAALGEIWAIADKENNGFLTRKGVAFAVRLIGYAQHAPPGDTVQEAWLERPGPLAHIDGISKPSAPSTPTPRSPPPATALTQIPPLTPQDKNNYIRLFTGCGPTNGLLGGEKARDVFLKSKLPLEKLSQIWRLADTQNRGSLDQTDFIVAMYLIQATLSGKLPFVPTSLPPGLYDQAAGKTISVLSAQSTGSGGSFSPPLGGTFPTSSVPTQYTGSTVPTQYTGQSHLRPQSTGQQFKSPLSNFQPVTASPSAGPQWDVTSEAKANSDRLFDTLDKQRRGFIEGDAAVPFFVQSKLPEEVLAQIWDLSDLHHDGRLTRDGFAIAMYLIQGKLTGREVPPSLPESLIPPSLRQQHQPKPNFPVNEHIQDLLWDDEPTPAPPPAKSPAPAPVQPQLTNSWQSEAIAPARPVNTFLSPFASTADRSLLEEDDDVVTPANIKDDSAEIGNLQIQVNSTQRSLDRARADRAAVDQAILSQASQLASLQTQLSSAKAAYETESRLLSTLQERSASQTAEIQQIRDQLIHAESELSGVKVEKSEIEGSFLRDKEEVRELQRRMKEVGDETELLKASLEKSKREAKQQKGLLAIAKKQLAAKESERAKAEQEAKEAEEELTETTRELEQTEADLAAITSPFPQPNGGVTSPPTDDAFFFAASQPLPTTPSPQPTSPPMDATPKSTNPFDRFMVPSRTTSPKPSPFDPPRVESVATTSLDPFGLDLNALTPDPVQLVHAVDTSESSFSEISPSPIANESTVIIPPKIEESPPKAATSDLEAEAATHFPAIDAEFTGTTRTASTTPFATLTHSQVDTDLSGPLEIEQPEESDSDSDDEQHYQDARASSQPPPKKIDDHSELLDGAPAITAKPAPNIFDPFGMPLLNGSTAVKTPDPAPAAPKSDPALDLFQLNTSSVQPSDSGKEVFDLAFNDNFRQAPKSPDVAFNKFDDSFDFSVASAAFNNKDAPGGSSTSSPQPASAFPPVPDFGKPSSPKNSFSPAPNVFAPSSPNNSFAPTQNGNLLENGATPKASSILQGGAGENRSFSEIFRGFGDIDSSGIALDSSQITASSRTTEVTPPTSPQPKQQFPTTSTPASPSTDSHHGRLGRPISPPPRVSSPNPRTSTASSKDSHDKHDKHDKPSTSTRSKLSQIRLPFGRKDRKKTKPEAPPPQPPPPQPSSILLPSSRLVAEPGNANLTPAVPDDVEPVKQLCGMGFSRSQAVSALENNDYDVQKALNSLVGTT